MGNAMIREPAVERAFFRPSPGGDVAQYVAAGGMAVAVVICLKRSTSISTGLALPCAAY
jgi:hypothetical protein